MVLMAQAPYKNDAMASAFWVVLRITLPRLVCASIFLAARMISSATLPADFSMSHLIPEAGHFTLAVLSPYTQFTTYRFFVVATRDTIRLAKASPMAR